MKAKDYFDKYHQQIWEEANAMMTGTNVVLTDGPMAQMFIEFATEMKDIIKLRNAKTDNAVLAIIAEQNQKWNAVVRLFEKKYGQSPIKRNGFGDGFKKQLGV